MPRRRRSQEDEMLGIFAADSDDVEGGSHSREEKQQRPAASRAPPRFVSASARAEPKEEADESGDKESNVSDEDDGNAYDAPRAGLGAHRVDSDEAEGNTNVGSSNSMLRGLGNDAFRSLLQRAGAVVSDKAEENGNDEAIPILAQASSSRSSGGFFSKPSVAPGVGPAPAQVQPAAFERHTKGFASRYLAQFGFSGRLGAKESGITAPIVAQLRPERLGLGAGGRSERSSGRDDARRRRGSDSASDGSDGSGSASDSDVESGSASGGGGSGSRARALRGPGTTSTAGAKRGTGSAAARATAARKRPRAPVYRTAAQVLAAADAASGPALPSAAGLAAASGPGFGGGDSGKILDMRGPNVRVVSLAQLSALSDASAAAVAADAEAAGLDAGGDTGAEEDEEAAGVGARGSSTLAAASARAGVGREVLHNLGALVGLAEVDLHTLHRKLRSATAAAASARAHARAAAAAAMTSAAHASRAAALQAATSAVIDGAREALLALPAVDTDSVPAARDAALRAAARQLTAAARAFARLWDSFPVLAAQSRVTAAGVLLARTGIAHVLSRNGGAAWTLPADFDVSGSNSSGGHGGGAPLESAPGPSRSRMHIFDDDDYDAVASSGGGGGGGSRSGGYGAQAAATLVGSDPDGEGEGPSRAVAFTPVQALPLERVHAASATLLASFRAWLMLLSRLPVALGTALLAAQDHADSAAAAAASDRSGRDGSDGDIEAEHALRRSMLLAAPARGWLGAAAAAAIGASPPPSGDAAASNAVAAAERALANLPLPEAGGTGEAAGAPSRWAAWRALLIATSQAPTAASRAAVGAAADRLLSGLLQGELLSGAEQAADAVSRLQAACESALMRRIRSFIAGEWDARAPTPLLAALTALAPASLVDDAQVRAQLPMPPAASAGSGEGSGSVVAPVLVSAAGYRSTLEGPLLARLAAALEHFDPMLDDAPLAQWLLPWASASHLLGARKSSRSDNGIVVGGVGEAAPFAALLPALSRKLGEALVAWHPSDGSALATLAPWVGVWDACAAHAEPPVTSFQSLLLRAVLPKLRTVLQSELTVEVPLPPLPPSAGTASASTPLPGSLEPASWVLAWRALLPPLHFSCLIEGELLPRWLRALARHARVRPAGVPSLTLAQWYSAWRRLLAAAPASPAALATTAVGGVGGGDDPLLGDARLQSWFLAALSVLAEVGKGLGAGGATAAAEGLAALALGQPDETANEGARAASARAHHARGYDWALARRVRLVRPTAAAAAAARMAVPVAAVAPPPPLPLPHAGTTAAPDDAALTLRDVLEAAASDRGLALLPHPRALRVAGCEVLLLARDAPLAAVYVQSGVAFLHAAHDGTAGARALPRPLRPLTRHEPATGAGTWLPLSIPSLLDAVDAA